MELHEFPRPPQDNGRGVHWSQSVYEWGKRDWEFWREQLLAMNIKWVKIMDDGGGSGLRVARQLIDIEIMPVVRLYRPQQNPGTIGDRGGKAVRRYVQAGVMYFETNNEPDLDLEWRYPKPPEWLDIVVDDFIVDADIVLAEGGYPAVPAFGVGTLRDPFAKMVERGRRDILDGGAWAAIHNYCLARPLEYPNDPVNLLGMPITEQEWQDAGGMWAWEMDFETVNKARRENAKPDANIATDSTCFRGFEFLDQIIRRAVGHSIPIMMTEGGYNVGQRAGNTYGDDTRYAKPTPQAASEMSLEMFRYMQGDRQLLGKKVPDYFFAAMPWLIAAYRIGVWSAPAENQGPWFTHHYDVEFDLHGELPLVAMLKDLPVRVRVDGPTPQQWIKPPYHQELGRNWDCRLKYLGVTLEPAPTTGGSGSGTSPYWKLVEAQWYDEEESLAAGYIFVKALDQEGNPIEDATFIVARPDASEQLPTKGSIDGYWGNYAMYAVLGTYSVRMSMGGPEALPYPSETVVGLGLGLEDAHRLWARTAFRLTFQLVKPQAAPGGSDEAEKLAALRKAALEAARIHIIPLNASSPLHLYARQHELGERLSAEFMLEHSGVQYRAQAFVKGVVYAPSNAPDQISHVLYTSQG